MRFLSFFYRGPGILLVIVGGIMFVAYVIHQGQEKAAAQQSSNQPTRELGKTNPTSNVDPSVASKETVLSNKQLSPPHNVEPDPVKTTSVSNQVSQPRAPLPTLITFYSQVAAVPPVEKPKEKPVQPEQLWLPPSIFIPCVLVNTVESSHINTPVVGEVLRDVYQNGKLIISAGTIVSSFASSGAVRDRIEVAGSWLLVFHDGRQLKVNGIACVRQANPENQQFGVEDGSAGLLGELKESDHWANAKAFIALLMTSATQAGTAAVSGAVSHGLGAGVGVGLPDTSPIMAKYLDQLLNGSTGDGRYVQVAAGTEFYIFPTETVLPTHRSVENSATNKEDLPQVSTDPITQQAIQTEREIMRASQPKPDENQTPHYRY
jgi:hypothetical protein